MAGSTSGTPYLATFLAILPSVLVSNVLAIPFPILIIIYALPLGLGAVFFKQDKPLHSIAILILYPVVLSTLLFYVASIEPNHLLQAFITLVTIWLSALFLGKQ